MCITVYVGLETHVHAMAHVWMSEARLWHLFLFFYQTGGHLRDQTQVVTLGGRCLYLVRRLTSLRKNSQYTNKFIDKRLKVTLSRQILGERWEEDNPE